MLIQSINVKGLLSFKDASLEMRPLNVLIGPNASGKSNFLEIMALLRALPRDLPEFFRRSGGVADWWWKGAETQDGQVRARFKNPAGTIPLDYDIQLVEVQHQPYVKEESLNLERPQRPSDTRTDIFSVEGALGEMRQLQPRGGYHYDRLQGGLQPDHPFTPRQSILAQVRDNRTYPEMTLLGEKLTSSLFYREWNMGRNSVVRKPVRTNEPGDFLLEDFSNLALVVNKLQLTRTIATIEEMLRRFSQSYERVQVQIDGGTALLMIREKGLDVPTPATRLSDGTLRFLALLTILCHPEPPPLICIEEPELGLHPDIIPIVAELLRSASERTQLVVTTHSKRLIDEFSDEPESVVVCERDPEEGTQFQRLSKDRLGVWLERYELGELWEKGEIGGNRW